MTKSFLTRLALVCVIVVGVVSILATGGGGSSSGDDVKITPPTACRQQ